MTIDNDKLSGLLLAVEARLDAQGWDQVATFWILYDDADVDSELKYQDVYGECGPAIRHGGYAARPVMPPGAPIPNAAHSAFRMALNLTFGAPIAHRVRANLAAPGFIGYAVAFEGYGLHATPQERAALGNVNLADVAGSHEVRNVLAVDVAMTVHDVKHRRGEAARAETARLASSADDPEGGYFGAMPISLAAIVSAVAGLEPVELIVAPVGWNWDEQTVHLVVGGHGRNGGTS